MKKLTVWIAVVLAASLACSGTGSSLADQECTPAADANACDTCLITACEDTCRACVDDVECYKCTDGGDSSACEGDPETAAFLACLLTAPCQTECTAEPPKKKRLKGGGGGGGGGKGGKGKRGKNAE
ncbi:MAG: hypothetical protein ABMB14_28035 [Myxococcota bacterium]